MSKLKLESILNAVEGFDPAICKAKESAEIPLETQLLWFRLLYPAGRLVYRVVNLTEKRAIIEARLYTDHDGGEDSYVSNSIGMSVQREDDPESEYIRRAESMAAQKALFEAGFGVQCAVELSDGVEGKPARKRAAAAAPEEKAPEKEPTAPTAEEVPAVKEEPVPAAPEEPAENVTPIPLSSEAEPLEQVLKTMTLQEAVKVIVGVGASKGKTIGQIAKENPKELYWFRDSYKGPDNQLRAAATLLLRAAGAAEPGEAETKAA